MVDLVQARECVLSYLQKLEENINAFGSRLPGYENKPKMRLVITKEQEYEFGWVFSYNNQQYIESKQATHNLAGNSPLIFDRNDGQIYVTGTARRIEFYIEEYRQGKRRRAD